MSERRTWAAVLVVALVAEAMPACAGEMIPFTKALDDAAISVERLDDILDCALLIGNGDINALVHTDSGNIEMVLTKNDVWDARLDTALDPPLPTLTRIKELSRGPWPNRDVILPEGSTWEGSDSYHAHPYPCPRACARLVLGTRPGRPHWRNIRAPGRHNGWEPDDGDAVMSIEGDAGVSNGWQCAPITFSTDDYHTMRLALSGSANAQYYVDLMDLAGNVLFATKWQATPVETQTYVFTLPSGKTVGSVILYTTTVDGKRARNRFEKLEFEGPRGTLPVVWNLPSLPTTRAHLDLRRAVAQIDGAPDGPPRAAIRALAQRNALVIEANVAARLEQFRTADTPDARTGETGGVRWLPQTSRRAVFGTSSAFDLRTYEDRPLYLPGASWTAVHPLRPVLTTRKHCPGDCLPVLVRARGFCGRLRSCTSLQALLQQHHSQPGIHAVEAGSPVLSISSCGPYWLRIQSASR